MGALPAGTTYAGYAPAGSFTLTVGGRTVAQDSAFGWAAQYAVGAKGRASLSLSQFPFVPLVVLVELAVWVLLAGALIGRPRRMAVPIVAPSVVLAPEDASDTLGQTVAS